MNRRHFIKKTGAAAGLLSLPQFPVYAFDVTSAKHVTILHTNDVHSHIDPFPATDSRNPNKGGVARRMALIEQIRTENPHTLLFDAGDIFQGTPYFNYYHGELEFKLMSMMQYHAATIGNHDFDNGIEGLFKQMPNATFELISSNYDFSKTMMDTHVKKYKTYEVNGIKIGVFGLGIELNGLVDKKMYKETVYLDPLEITKDMTRQLKETEKCDLIICLSHLGYHYKNDKISDLSLAAATQDIDLIIGGHTHTFLKKPSVVKNALGKNMLVNQVGFAGINLGRIDFYLDEKGNISSDGLSIIV